MPVEQVNLNPEQKALEQMNQQQREDDFAQKLVDSVDLPANLSKNIDEANRRAAAGEEEQHEEEQEEEQEQEEQPEQETSEKKEEPEEEEDLIPRSKVQRRIDELTAQTKRLQMELEKVKESEKVAKAKDDEQSRLEQMSDDELKNLKKQVRNAQFDNLTNKEQYTRLLDLEEKIDNAMKTAPERFQKNQIDKLNQEISYTASEVQGFDKAYPEILKTAQDIYKDSPELQGSVSGQARAWKLAVNHYNAINKLTAGKSKTEELERKVTTLKKKVAMDGGSPKSSQKEDTNEKAFNKARYGTPADKLKFMKTKINVNNLVDPEYLERFS